MELEKSGNVKSTMEKGKNIWETVFMWIINILYITKKWVLITLHKGAFEAG